MKYIVKNKNIKKKETLRLTEYLYILLIYYYSFYALNASISNYNNGEMPSFFIDIFPFLNKLMKVKNADYNVSDRSIIVYFIIIDFIRRPIVPFPRIVKFNIILTYLIEFSLLILAEIWDLLLTKDTMAIKYQFRDEENIYDLFYSIIWIIYAIIYFYCGIFAIQGKYPGFFKPFDKIVPSIHFFLNTKDFR